MTTKTVTRFTSLTLRPSHLHDGLPVTVVIGQAGDGCQTAVTTSDIIAAGTLPAIVKTGLRLLTSNPPATTDNAAANNRAIREWAQRNGIEVNNRGRIKQAVIGLYNDAH